MNFQPRFSTRMEEDRQVVTVTIPVKIDLYLGDPAPHWVVNGLYVAVKIINDDFVQVGQLLVHRPSLKQNLEEVQRWSLSKLLP